MGPFHISLGEFLIATLIAELIFEPISVLIHELGHAVAALRLSSGMVRVEVGRGQPWFALIWNRLTIDWSPKIRRTGGFRGICRWNARGSTARERMLVHLGGPIATALLVPLYAFAAYMLREDAPWVPAIFVFAAFGALVSFIANLDPREKAIVGSVSPMMEMRDGIKARNAYRQIRRGENHRTPTAGEWTIRPDRPGPPPTPESRSGDPS